MSPRALAAACLAVAQPAAADPAGDWTVTVAPYLWAISLDGDVGVGPVEAEVDLPFSDILPDLSFGGMLLVDANRDRFGVAFNGVFARVSPDGEAGPFEVDTTIDTLHLGVAPYYRLVDWTWGQAASGAPLRLRVEPTAGFRLTRLRAELDVRGGRTVDQTETWIDPLIGSRFAIDLAERWTLWGEADIGGFGVGSDFAWNTQAFLGYRTSLFGRPTDLVAGYRALGQDYEDGNFSWDVVSHGPILGLAVKF